MAKTALLVMDVQAAIVRRFGDDADYLGRLRRAIDAARAASIPVIFVRVGFREGYPEVSQRNKGFSAIKEQGRFTGADLEPHPDVAPRPGDIVITKRRISAFTGSDLDVVLRAADVEELVLTGIATSGVVLSTLCEAYDLDFRITVLSDGCLDADADVHRVLTEKIFPGRGEVITVDDWTKRL